MVHIKLQDNSGSRFPTKRCSRSEDRSPVIYYGKKVSKDRIQSGKENKETVQESGIKTSEEAGT